MKSHTTNQLLYDKSPISKFEQSHETIEYRELRYPFAKSFERKDWHDYEFIIEEALREGPGEHGKPYELTDPEEKALNEQLVDIEGMSVIVSDKISVNRSIPDTRDPRFEFKILSSLPI